MLKGLVSSGMVCAIPPQHSGKNQLMYVISNRYFKGEPFPRKERAEKKEEEEKEVRPLHTVTHRYTPLHTVTQEEKEVRPAHTAAHTVAHIVAHRHTHP